MGIARTTTGGENMKRGASLAIAATGALVLLPLVLPPYGLQVAIQAMILALFAMSFNFLFHQTGLLSFGHAIFFGTGAYTTALLMEKAGWPYLLTLPAVLLTGIAVSVLIGFFSIRTSKIYFTMLTLAFAQMFYAVALKWYSFTGGDNGITGLIPGGILGSARGLYYLSLLLTLASILLLHRLIRAPFGYALRAIRDDSPRARAIGLNPFNYMLAAFVVSGTLSALAGFLQVAWQRSAFPDFFFWTRSAEVIVAAILGGTEVFLGPAVGAAAFVFLQALVQSRTEYWPFVIGMILLLLVIFLPRGLVGALGQKTAARRRAGHGPA